MDEAEEAWLVSEHFDPVEEADCFTFWYHMYGSGRFHSVCLSVCPMCDLLTVYLSACMLPITLSSFKQYLRSLFYLHE
jgi:hypothetical protein